MTTEEKIRSRGHWIITVRPTQYSTSERVPLAQLENAVRTCSVSLRGWDFPHWDVHNRPQRLFDSVTQSIDWMHHIEKWQAYQSLQFVCASGIWEDWRDQSPIWGTPPGWVSGSSLSIASAVFRLVEAYEFAARWAGAVIKQDLAYVECTLAGMKGRALTTDPNRVGFFEGKVSSLERWTHKATPSLIELSAQPRDLAIGPAIALFEQFGWDTDEKMIREIQSELGR